MFRQSLTKAMKQALAGEEAMAMLQDGRGAPLEQRLPAGQRSILHVIDDAFAAFQKPAFVLGDVVSAAARDVTYDVAPDVTAKKAQRAARPQAREATARDPRTPPFAPQLGSISEDPEDVALAEAEMAAKAAKAARAKSHTYTREPETTSSPLSLQGGRKPGGVNALSLLAQQSAHRNLTEPSA